MDPHATTKYCHTCKQEKPVSCFGLQTRARDGLQSRCKQCIRDYYTANSERGRERARQWALDHPERVKSKTRARARREQQRRHETAQQRTEKPCKVCGNIKPLDQFPRRTSFLDGRSATCTSCYQAYTRVSRKKWELKNPGKRREGTLRRRARIKKLRVGVVSYERIYDRDKGICHLCGLPVTFKLCHFDHVIPLSRGGPHTEDNIAVAHGLCNQKKSAKLLEEL